MDPDPPPVCTRVRHRPFLGVSGIVLFVSMFLPAMKTCHESTYPTEVPMFLPPYLFGLGFAACAFIVDRRVLRVVTWIVRALCVGFVLLAVGVVVYAPILGVAELAIAASLLAAIGVSGADERRLATLAIIMGGLQVLWFALIASPPEGMIGGQLSFFASLGLLVGGVLWRGGIPPPVRPALPPPPVELPRAIIHR